MLRNNKKYIQMVMLLAIVLAGSSCKKDYTDPSRATDENVFSTPGSITGVTVGLQRVYSLSRASSLYNIVTGNGLITRELFVINQGNTAEFQLQNGGTAVDGTNTMLAGLWTTSNKIIYDADKAINAAATITDKGIASGVIAYASIYKALSIGTMSMFWEKVPADIGTNVTFVTRAEGFTKAIAVIDAGLAAVSANAISASFLSNIPAGIDIVNTLQALKARYSLYLGNYTQALASANAVDLSKKSTMNYEAANPNPIYDILGSNVNVCQPIDSTMSLPGALAPDLADKRVPFYMVLSGSPIVRFGMKGFASGTTVAFPIYLPSEMTLIKAEVYARQSTPDLTNSLIELNKVVTKKAANDPFGVGADLPPLAGPLTQAQLLNEIYRNRCIELFMSGLKLEDMRRFDGPNSERSRNLMPYPFRERDNNPNTPPDPSF